MNIDLTPILQALIALLACIVTYKLIPWIKSKTTTEQQAQLQTAVKVLVYAAEQIYGAGKGKEKLQYVVDNLENRGYTADIAAIEACIKEHIVDLHIGKPYVDALNGDWDDETETEQKE